MAEVDSYTYTTTKVRKTKKTASTKRRESQDGGDITITEISEKENHVPSLTNGLPRKQRYCFWQQSILEFQINLRGENKDIIRFTYKMLNYGRSQNNPSNRPYNFGIHEPHNAAMVVQLIFSGEFTKAMNKDWHSTHFCCWQCDESLTGQRYVLRDDHPYCIKCYESVFANPCEECNKIIGIDSKDLSYKDKHWHEACFLCTKCHVSLVDKQFGSKLEKIYCGNCYDAQFASRCDGCGDIFRAGKCLFKSMNAFLKQ
ncbi:hypothetical protein V9T40_008863 [Parthenolecanium corni]|uniref:LIM zinc-binding domain-containing protein n=1 Tax=Parthenolecanium corni TaxID=536013 RepID=A0AAN9TPD8_9HEMI